jgi:hypothetical protein
MKKPGSIKRIGLDGQVEYLVFKTFTEKANYCYARGIITDDERDTLAAQDNS